MNSLEKKKVTYVISLRKPRQNASMLKTKYLELLTWCLFSLNCEGPFQF